MSRPPHPEPAQLRGQPVLLTREIPPEWEDHNGHVNIQYYLTLYEKAGWPLVMAWGMDESYFLEQRRGVFDLEHHIFYLSELHVGDRVSVYSRILDRTRKRIHGMMFVVDDTRDLLASTIEYVSTAADLRARRTAAIPDDIAAKIDADIERDKQLPWAAPVCGIMSA